MHVEAEKQNQTPVQGEEVLSQPQAQGEGQNENPFLDPETRLKELEDHFLDLRSTKPIEPQYVSPELRQEMIEAIREGVGLLKFAYESIYKLYLDVGGLIELCQAKGLDDNFRTVLTDLLLKLEGVIHVTKTLTDEFGDIWAGLRAHELWEMLQAERKRLQAEMRARARRSRKKAQDEETQDA